MASNADHVDQIVAEWRRACPSVDPAPIGVTGRITRIALYTHRDAGLHLQPYRLTRSGFDVLAALDQHPSHRLSPTSLARGQRMSSAGITGLIDQLAALGLVARSTEAQDRRRVAITLTPRGSGLIRIAAGGWRINEDRLSRQLGARATSRLDGLLGRLLAKIDSGSDEPVDGTNRRITRMAQHINAEAEVVFGRFGLSHGGFQVLASLYRAGPPYRRSPSGVARGLMLSGAGLTARMDQLERGGLLGRERDLGDRRAVIVELTPAGRRLVRTAFPEFVGSHARLLDLALSPSEQGLLAELLRAVLRHFEPTRAPRAHPADSDVF